MTATKTAAAVAGEPIALEHGAHNEPTARRRVVLLGASNLTNGFASAVRRLRQIFQEPLEILAAYGHGRSYGTRSVVFGRMLPGIEGCGLWSELERRPPLPTSALVTDIGNDVLYEAPVDSITEWVATALDRLARFDAQIAITELPVVNLPRLRSWQYLLLRRALFPKCEMSFDEVRSRAEALNERVHALARERRLAIVSQRAEWYGLDPIHVLDRHERAAWRAFLSPLGSPQVATSVTVKAVAGRVPRSVSGYSLAPEQRWLFGREQRRRQPSRSWPDGTTFSVY